MWGIIKYGQRAFYITTYHVCLFLVIIPSLNYPHESSKFVSPNATNSCCDKVSYVPTGPFFSRQHSLGDTACGCPRIQNTTTFLQTLMPEGKHSTKYHHHENSSNCVGKEKGGSQATKKEIEGF